MLFAAHTGVGLNICLPDVCKTPPLAVPIPYINVALHAIAVPFSLTTFICMLPALNLLSKIPVTTGDQAGALGPGPCRPGTFVVGNPFVRVDRFPAVNFGCKAMGNGVNAAGGHIVPNVVNVLYCFARGEAGEGEGEPLRGGEIEALGAAVYDGPAPRGQMIEERVMLLQIPVFSADLPTIVFREIEALERSGGRALILDLRGCPGGLLDAGIRLAGDFLPKGAVIATVVDADGDETVHLCRRERRYDMPLAVLVDEETASAAELFAGCLQAHGRATLVGQKTFGKGRAESVVRSALDASVSRVTVARCTLPGGVEIEGAGLVPDVEAEHRPGAIDWPLSAAVNELLRASNGL